MPTISETMTSWWALLNKAELDKIDDAAVDGLAGVSNSLAYKVHEIEKHLHSSGSWFGKAATATATHFADRIGPAIDPFQLDAGNETWGDWVQILGADDTPARADQLFFDPHQVIISSVEKAGAYFIQMARGASGTAGFDAGNYTEFVYMADGTGMRGSGITDVQTGRAPAGSLLWARTLLIGENTGTIDFYMGVHEYAG